MNITFYCHLKIKIVFIVISIWNNKILNVPTKIIMKNSKQILTFLILYKNKKSQILYIIYD